MEKLRENAMKELEEIAKKGFTTTNIDTASKLVDMVKDIDEIKGKGDETMGRHSMNGYDDGMSRDRGMSYDGYDGGRSRDGYSHDGYSSDGYDDGNSYRRGRSERTGRYVHRPDYSHAAGDDMMGRYHQMKHEYSQARDNGSKQRMLDALNDAVIYVCDWVKQACRDSDCREERQILLKPVEDLYYYLKDM